MCQQHFAIRFFSLSGLNGILDIGYNEESSQIVFDLLYVLDAKFDVEKRVVSLDYKVQYTDEFEKRLNKFINKYKSILPQIQQLKKKFKNLKKGEWFFILPPEIKLTTEQKLKLERELSKLNNQKLTDEEFINKVFECVLSNYEIVGFDLNNNEKIKIGESDKKKRICRFCKKKYPETTFKEEAHAISEGLGNKQLILNEECDECNHFFDREIERDFIAYHDLLRVFFGIKVKGNKVPKLKGENFVFSKRDSKNLTMVITDDSVREKENGVPQNLILKTNHEIKMQNIYKALCKFALSVIEGKYIDYFDKTIRWLKGEIEVEKLPKVVVLNSYNFFARKPEIILYIRNNNNKKLPFLIGEFTLTYLKYIFIVPFSSQDDRDFLDTKEYEEFLNCFNHIKEIKNLSYVDFSDNTRRKLQFNINFKKRST
jgi:hypothetical protein